MKINPSGTHEAIRGRYKSVQKCADAFGVSKQVLYLAIAGKRGKKTHPAPLSEGVLIRLEREGLLVYESEVAA